MRVVVPAALVAFALGLPANRVAASGSFCAATASFSGSTIAIELNIDHSGKPAKGSQVDYQPSGGQGELRIVAVYPLKADRSVTAPSSLRATSRVSPSDAKGSFVLTLAGQEFRSSRPGMVLTGDPEWRGKVEVEQAFEMQGPLVEALASGGVGHLAYLDKMGLPLAQADLSFASATVIQGAVEKTYPTALAFTTSKGQC